jgi:hypothetical protein
LKDENGKTSNKMFFITRRWWLTPAILATKEAEIRRIVVRSQPMKIVCKPLSRGNSLEK